MKRLTAVLLLFLPSVCLAASSVTIVSPTDGGIQERLAAREIQRYVYLRTGELFPISNKNGDGESIVIAVDKSLPPQGYHLRTQGAGKRLSIVGGSSIGALYGAYRFIEHLGVRFYLHGDVIPDQRIAWKMSQVDEKGSPLFELRGLNPWGSHPFGFDQWGVEDYKALIAQLAKMRMNFIGMHCYLTHPYDEPTVWLGMKDQINDDGTVKTSYPSRYYNTLWKGRWGPILPKKTSDYTFGASMLFEDETWGPPTMKGFCPTPATPDACIELHNRVGRQFKEAFTFARLLGVKTCLGTEAPLKKFMPAALKQKLRDEGKGLADMDTVRKLYEGIFERIKRTHPLDYYWIWTPEGWTWKGNSEKDLADTVEDVNTAMKALEDVKPPFQLATSGWVLGPKSDRAAFDKAISKKISMSAISRTLGHTPLDPAFGRIEGRGKWAIPWLESDSKHGLAGLQLFAGRTLYDGAQARAYGCTGLMGLQWRTRALGPNALALARAGWEMTEGFAPAIQAEPVAPRDRTLGGQTANYPGKPIAGTEEDVLYQTCRYDLQGYLLAVPNGKYRVTLKFCEPHFAAKGQRVCDVELQGRKVLSNFDIFAKAGQSAAHDESFDDIEVTKGFLRLNIINRVSMACISGIVIEGDNFSRKINCGGPDWKDYKREPAGGNGGAATGPGASRTVAVDAFYDDLALASFGPEASKDIADIFTRIDGRVPISVGGGCPSGSLPPDTRSWNDVKQDYSFVEDMQAIRPRVRGAGNLERFDYWLNTFRYHAQLAEIRCALGRFEKVMKQVESQKDGAVRKKMALDEALPLYRALVKLYGDTVRLRMRTVTTHGGIATVVNLMQHAKFYPLAIDDPTRRLAAQVDLPADAQPSKAYGGPARIVVPTVRSVLIAGESLEVKAIIPTDAELKAVRLNWRVLGTGDFKSVPLKHVARRTYSARLHADSLRDGTIEYYIEATMAAGQTMHWPATAPTLNQTVVTVKK